MNSRKITLASRPVGMPATDNFGTENVEVAGPGEGQLKVQARYISVDPYMRGRMRDAKSYVPPFQVGEAIEGGVVAEVVESQHPDFEEGDYVLGNLPWQEVQCVEGDDLRKIDPEIAPPSYYLGILGMPGLTAYFGLLDIGQPQENDTVLVSAAAGAVGSVVGQLARIKGCRVVGIAGSDEKVRYLKEELQFDEAINYKTTDDMREALNQACPDGIDVYFDNVGGPISDAAMTLLNLYARVVVCGQISLYNNTEVPTGPRPQPIMIKNRVKMQGFIVSDYSDRFQEGIRDMAGWLEKGQLKYRETVTEGFEKLPEAFIGLFKGENIGKYLVKI